MAFRRFGLICRKLIVENRKSLLIVLCGFSGIWTLLGLWCGYLGTTPGIGPLAIYLFCASIACCVAASRMFSDLVSKEDRISTLMTPASAAEKFIPRLIAVIPGMIILVTLGYILFSYASILVAGLRFGNWADFYNPFAHWTQEDSSTLISLGSVFLFTLSFFIYGAVAWPRKSFFKTVLVLFAVQMVLGMIVYGIVKSLFAMRLYMEITDEAAFGRSVISIVCLIAVTIIYLAYRRLKNFKLN